MIIIILSRSNIFLLYKADSCWLGVIVHYLKPNCSPYANPLARSQGQVKLDSVFIFKFQPRIIKHVLLLPILKWDLLQFKTRFNTYCSIPLEYWYSSNKALLMWQWMKWKTEFPKFIFITVIRYMYILTEWLMVLFVHIYTFFYFNIRVMEI